MSVDLTGAADLHCHFGPDPHRARSVDAFEAAREAAAAGHRAIVLKSHDSPTAALAWAVQRDVGDDISVFGGICCDREVGGMNPAAVEVALGLGARIVWLPTLISRQDFENGVAAQLGIPGPGPRRHRRRRRAAPRDARSARARARARRRARDRSRERGRALRRRPGASPATGPVVLTHATEDLAGPKLDAAQCRELAELGAWVELCAMTCIGALATKTVAEMVATIRAVGVDRVTLGTDFGQAINPHPARRSADLRRRAVRRRPHRGRDPHAWRARIRAALLGLDD